MQQRKIGNCSTAETASIAQLSTAEGGRDESHHTQHPPQDACQHSSQGHASIINAQKDPPAPESFGERTEDVARGSPNAELGCQHTNEVPAAQAAPSTGAEDQNGAFCVPACPKVSPEVLVDPHKCPTRLQGSLVSCNTTPDQPHTTNLATQPTRATEAACAGTAAAERPPSTLVATQHTATAETAASTTEGEDDDDFGDFEVASALELPSSGIPEKPLPTPTAPAAGTSMDVFIADLQKALGSTGIRLAPARPPVDPVAALHSLAASARSDTPPPTHAGIPQMNVHRAAVLDVLGLRHAAEEADAATEAAAAACAAYAASCNGASEAGRGQNCIRGGEENGTRTFCFDADPFQAADRLAASPSAQPWPSSLTLCRLFFAMS
jgi:hypothetical protein